MPTGLPKGGRKEPLIGHCIGDVVYSETKEDVGFCIIWSDGRCEICLDQSAFLEDLHDLWIHPRNLIRLQNTKSPHRGFKSDLGFQPRRVNELKEYGAVVSIINDDLKLKTGRRA